jgi:hypothetical protein
MEGVKFTQSFAKGLKCINLNFIPCFDTDDLFCPMEVQIYFWFKFGSGVNTSFRILR